MAHTEITPPPGQPVRDRHGTTLLGLTGITAAHTSLLNGFFGTNSGSCVVCPAILSPAARDLLRCRRARPRLAPPYSPSLFACQERRPLGGRTLWPGRGGGGGGGDGRAVQGRQDGREQRHGNNDGRWHLAVLHEPMRRLGGVTSPKRQS
ncbi:hypothetical protein E2C01_074354 [Portunus trituberculatus]|uniref:Uncharacterized protein n=1 Tax=Portunus trituberculatus TaxID=210409 RepID=A0A5B7IG40_PORTR|nr:hypothetical protein [Portunus trituberculatus]